MDEEMRILSIIALTVVISIILFLVIGLSYSIAASNKLISDTNILLSSCIQLEQSLNNPCAAEVCNIRHNIDIRINIEQLLEQRYQNCLLKQYSKNKITE